MGFLDSYGGAANAFTQNLLAARGAGQQHRLELQKLAQQKAMQDATLLMQQQAARREEEEYSMSKANRQGMMGAIGNSITPGGEYMAQGEDPTTGDMQSSGIPYASKMDYEKALTGAIPYLDKNTSPQFSALMQIRQLPIEEQKNALAQLVQFSNISRNRAQEAKALREPVTPEKNLHFTTETKYDDKTKLSFTRTIGRDPITGGVKYAGDWGADPTKGREPVINVNMANDSQVNTLAKGIIDKTIDPNGISKRGGLQAAVWSKVKELDPAFDIVKAGAGAKFESNSGAMTTKALLNSIDPLLDNLAKAGEKLTDTGSPLINAPMQWAQKNILPNTMGGTEVTGFDNLRDDTIAEVERGLLNTGVLSDSKYLRAVKNLNTAQTQKQRLEAIKNIRTVISARLGALEEGPYKDRARVDNPTSPGPMTALPPAASAKGRTIKRSDGIRLQSDGTKWNIVR